MPLPATQTHIQLLQSVDPDGNTVALIRREGESRFIIFAPVQNEELPTEVDIAEVSTEAELRSRIAGEIVLIDDASWDETLENWNYTGSKKYLSAGTAEDGTETDASTSEADGVPKDADGNPIAPPAEGGFVDETRNSDEPGPKTEGGTLTDADHAPSTGIAPDQDPDADQGVGPGEATSADPQPAAQEIADPATKPDQEMHGETERTSAQEETKKEQAGI